MKLALTLERAAAHAGGRRGRDKVGGGSRRQDEPKTNKLRVIDVKLGKTQLLKPFNTLSGHPEACWCDLGICSQGGEERLKGVGEDPGWVSALFSLFNSLSYLHCPLDT